MNGFENGNVRYDDLHRIIHNNVSSYEVIKKSDVASAIETTSNSEGDSDYADCEYDDYQEGHHTETFQNRYQEVPAQQGVPMIQPNIPQQSSGAIACPNNGLYEFKEKNRSEEGIKQVQKYPPKVWDDGNECATFTVRMQPNSFYGLKEEGNVVFWMATGGI